MPSGWVRTRLWSASWYAIVAGTVVATVNCSEPHELRLFPKPTKAEPEPPLSPEPSACPPDHLVNAEAQCVECLEDGDCKGGKPGCLTGTCVECTLDEHCPMDKHCNSFVGRCARGCSDAEPCDEKGAPVCDATRGLCVECVENTDCEKPDKPICEGASGVCVECVENANCTKPDKPSCDVSMGVCAMPAP